MNVVVPTTTTRPLTEDYMEGQVVWLFWRKVLKLRNYKPLSHVINVYKTEKSIRAEVCYFFTRDIGPKRVVAIHVTKRDGLYFTVAIGSKVFKSELCFNLGEFEDEFKKYFKRTAPIMPPGVGTLPGSDNYRDKKYV